jgi:L-lactate dehydrogenase complex protein LldG
MPAARGTALDDPESKSPDGGAMSEARRRILARIRERQGRRAERDDAETALVSAHLDAHARNPTPGDSWEPVTRFRERALSLASTIDEVADAGAAPGCIARYLHERDLPLQAVCWPELEALDWIASGIVIEARAARGDDLVGVTGAYCAIAETGTLMLASGVETPSTVSVLPETHIAVVHRSRIVVNMEDAWALWRTEHPGLPRTVNFISGPSRTADIEQTVTLGAHGPYRVHIVLVGLG